MESKRRIYLIEQIKTIREGINALKVIKKEHHDTSIQDDLYENCYFTARELLDYDLVTNVLKMHTVKIDE